MRRTETPAGCFRRTTRRAPRAAMVSTATALVFLAIVLVTGCATADGHPDGSGNADTPALATDELLVMSFNIRMIYDADSERSRWIERRADVAELIRRQDATVVALQEVENRGAEPMPPSDQLVYLQRELPEYAFACIPEPGILSRQPILYDASRLRLLDEGMVLDAPVERYREGFRGRVATWALFALHNTDGSGDSEPALVRVVNVHYHHLFTSSQLESSWRLREFIERGVSPDEAVVVLGDFNLPARSRVLDPLRDAGLSHALPATSGSFHFFTGVPLWPRIDHVLVNERLEPLGGGLVRDRGAGGFPSDHYPVVSRLRVRGWLER